MTTALEHTHTVDNTRGALGIDWQGVNAVLRKSFYDSRRATLWLAFGLALYTLFIMSFYPAMKGQASEFEDLIKEYPEGFTSLFYSGDIEDFSLSEPGNFIHMELMIWMLLTMGFIVIGQAFNSFTNAERDHTLDVMLSLPVSRRSYLIGRVLNTVLVVLVVLLVEFLTLLASSFIWSEIDFPVGKLLLAVFGMFFPLMVVAMFAYMLATVIPSGRRFAGPVAQLFLLGSYLLHGFSGSAEALKNTRPLYLFDYYNAGAILTDGVVITDWLILAGVAVVYFAVSYWAVERKELGV